MNFSDKFARVKPSATISVNTRALELKAQGADIISLAIGDPDFITPPHIREAAKEAIDAGFTRYTAAAGIPELRKAAAGYFARQYGVEPKPANVVITNGGKQAIYNLLQALLNPGEEVLIPAPYWVSYPDMVTLCDGVPVIVPAPVEAGFKVSPATLERKATGKTKALILNTPSNPTGVTYTQDEVDAIMQWAMDKGIFVLADEIYDQLVYAPAKHATAIHWWKKYPDMVAICNGVSKSFAMTGWRLGYSVTGEALTKLASTLQGQTTSNVCSITQKAALAALTGSYDCVAEMRAAFQRRRDMGHAIVKGWKKAVCPMPDGAFYLFVDVHGYFTPDMPDDVALSTMLLEKANVAVVPGSAFGDAHCIRLSYATADDTLKEALRRMGEALEG